MFMTFNVINILLKHLTSKTMRSRSEAIQDVSCGALAMTLDLKFIDWSLILLLNFFNKLSSFSNKIS